MSKWKVTYDKTKHWYKAEKDNLTGFGISIREAKIVWRFIANLNKAVDNLHIVGDGVAIGTSKGDAR